MNDSRPTKKQRELLNFIDGFIKGNGYGPSYREVMRALEYKSVSTVATHIDGLITRGFLRKKDNSARSIEVVTLTGHEEVAPSPQTLPDQTTWLVEQVTERLERYATGSSEDSLDELGILVETLRLLQLESAYQLAKVQLGRLQAQEES